MHVALISRDDSLRRICQEVLPSLPGPPWSLRVAAPDEPAPVADLYLWDWDRHAPAPRLLDTPRHQAHMLVIGREEARTILQDLPLTAMTLVLKPVTHDALRAFLQQGAARIESQRNDRDAIFDCLLATTLRLQEYDQDRMNFLARAMHDFRTPLTAVNGYCGLLLSAQLGPLNSAQQEVVERTLHSVRRLTRLATALFQWSSGLGVGLRAEMREADIEECVRQAFYEIRPLAAEKNISVDLDLKPPGQPLCLDPAQMEQLLVNLLENSCKFTPRGGDVQVRGFPAFWERRCAAVSRDGVPVDRRQGASRRPNAYRMEISDNGMRVEPEHLETIFQEHTSSGGGAERSGSGVGLAICKRILAEHGGHIFAQSGRSGVTFVFMLPFTQPAADRGSGGQRGIHLVPETVERGKP